LYNLSLEEARKNIEPDSTLRTGAQWGGVWTRDVSYSTLLAFAYHEPEVAKISLLRKVKRDRIIQDTGPEAPGRFVRSCGVEPGRLGNL
jgi:hypothetical protein